MDVKNYPQNWIQLLENLEVDLYLEFYFFTLFQFEATSSPLGFDVFKSPEKEIINWNQKEVRDSLIRSSWNFAEVFCILLKSIEEERKVSGKIPAKNIPTAGW